MSEEFRDRPDRHRFELDVDGEVAWVRYTLQPGQITLIHTEVPRALEGRGVGSRIARAVLDHVRASGLKLVVVCPFITAWMKKHPEYDDLLG